MDVTKILPDEDDEFEEDSLENLLDKEDTLDEVLENLEEEIEKNIQRKAQVKFTLDRTNVSLNMDHGAPIKDLEEDLEDIPVKKDDKDDKGIEYNLMEDDSLKYEHIPKENVEASQKALTTPEKLLEEQMKMYSRKKEDDEIKPLPTRKMESIRELNKENYQKRDYEAVV